MSHSEAHHSSGSAVTADVFAAKYQRWLRLFTRGHGRTKPEDYDRLSRDRLKECKALVEADMAIQATFESDAAQFDPDEITDVLQLGDTVNERLREQLLAIDRGLAAFERDELAYAQQLKLAQAQTQPNPPAVVAPTRDILPPVFDGSRVSYHGWWKQFDSLVHQSPRFSDAEK